MKVGDLIRSWFAVSTAHGVTYVANGKTTLQRLVWLILCVSACGAFGYYLIKSVQKYNSEPTSMRLVQRGAPFVPPDLHFCHTNPFSRSRMIHAHDVNSSAMLELQRDLNLVEKALNESLDNRKLQSYFLWSSVSHNRLFSTLGHLLPQTVSYAGDEENATLEMSTFVPTSAMFYFSCFRIQSNVTGGLASVSDSLFFELYTDSYHLHPTLLSFGGQPLHRYRFGLPPNVAPVSGLVLVITPPDGYPHVESNSVLLSPARYTTVSVRMEQTLAVSTDHSPCQSEPQYVDYVNRLLGDNTTVRYVKTLSDCKYGKVLDEMLRENADCQCIPFFAPVTPEVDLQFPVCHNVSRALHTPQNVTLLKHLVDTELMCNVDYFSRESKFDYLTQCVEENPCETLTYYSDVSSSDWPLDDVIDDVIDEQERRFRELLDIYEDLPGLNEYLNDISANVSLRKALTKYNIAKVHVKIGDTRGLLIVESVSYNVEDCISDVGGLAGLWLGISFLSVLEIFNLLHDLVLWRMKW